MLYSMSQGKVGQNLLLFQRKQALLKSNFPEAIKMTTCRTENPLEVLNESHNKVLAIINWFLSKVALQV